MILRLRSIYLFRVISRKLSGRLLLCGVTFYPSLRSVLVILELQNYIPRSKKKKVLNVVFITVFRSIWKMRNESLFSQKVPSIAKVVEEVKALGFLWIKNRSRTSTMTWDD
ncbi:hypothetical protein Hanom_Chr17g01571811 [Helianthus anomalus]